MAGSDIRPDFRITRVWARNFRSVADVSLDLDPQTIVAYDINKPGQNYDELIELIKSYSSVEVGKSFWVIATQ